MAAVRVVRRRNRVYRYLEQSYRWEGKVRKKRVYLGTRLPRDLEERKRALERSIWRSTWFAEFDKIREGYQRRSRTVPGSVLEKERMEFVVEFTYDTNRIEGSTLTFDDTRLLLDRGITTVARPLHDLVETQRHARLLTRLLGSPEPLTLANVVRWHAELFSETKPDLTGKFRDFDVRIGRSKHRPPPGPEVEAKMDHLFYWLLAARNNLHPVELAAEFHFRFENIHPFGDGNGRVGRLAMNVLLQSYGFPMLNIEYTRRSGYCNSLEASSTRDDPRSFLRFFFRRYSRAHRFLLGTRR
jgi:Fic family protein